MKLLRFVGFVVLFTASTTLVFYLFGLSVLWTTGPPENEVQSALQGQLLRSMIVAGFWGGLFFSTLWKFADLDSKGKK